MKDTSKTSINRRDFIRRSAVGAAAFAMAPMSTIIARTSQDTPPIVWPKDASKFKFYMIGHGHIDPVWLWPWREGIAVTHSTFRSALDRMNENPDFKFTSSQMQFYEWVAENDPKMLAEIRKRVNEGRWALVGGWWVEPDVNMPSGEAMARQGLYGQLLLSKLFGRRATTAFNPDSFGHTGNLPQIVSKQGMQNYVFMRPGPHEKDLPSDLFWWQSPDGTKVLTYRIQNSYNETNEVDKRLNTIMEKADKQPMSSFMAFYGVGDHGGGPTKRNLKSIDRIRTEKGAPVVVYSTPDNYFTDMRANKALALPTVADDLQHHAPGCYTADIEIKKGNRASETALVTAEKIASVGAAAWGARYPKEEFTKAWKRVLFLQFHDSAAGSSLAVHTKDAREGHNYAIDVAHTNMYMALQKLEWQIASEDPESDYLVVFNPNPWEVTANVEYDLSIHSGRANRIEDEKGNVLPHQWVMGNIASSGRKLLITRTTLPPMGYRQLRIVKSTDGYPFKQTARAEGNTMENEYYKLTFSHDGTVGILDKQTGKQVFTDNNGCRGVIIKDLSDTWSHDIKTFDEEIGAFDRANIKAIENGPLRARTRVVSTYGESTLTIDWILTAGSRNIEANVTVDWHEKLKMLKLSFPVSVENPTATYESSYGHIVRKTNGDEDPGQRWIDVTGTQGSARYGLTVMNDAKYGYSVHGGDMRISVVRSAPYAHHNPYKLESKEEYIWMDHGIQTMRLLLVPHKESWREAGITRIVEEFSEPVITSYQGIHPGTLPKSASFMTVDSPAVIVGAIKHSEVGDDLIVRCVETLGEATSATISFGFLNKTWKGDFKPCEIKTLRLSKNGIKEVNLLEE